MRRWNPFTINSQWKSTTKSMNEDPQAMTRLRKPTQEEVDEYDGQKKAKKRDLKNY